jgi:hypothetical protein
VASDVLPAFGKVPFKALAALLAQARTTCRDVKALIDAQVAVCDTLHEDDVRDGLLQCVVHGRADLLRTLLDAPVARVTRHQLAESLRTAIGAEVQLPGTPSFTPSGVVCTLLVGGVMAGRVQDELITRFAGKVTLTSVRDVEAPHPCAGRIGSAGEPLRSTALVRNQERSDQLDMDESQAIKLRSELLNEVHPPPHGATECALISRVAACVPCMHRWIRSRTGCLS